MRPAEPVKLLRHEVDALIDIATKELSRVGRDQLISPYARKALESALPKLEQLR